MLLVGPGVYAPLYPSAPEEAELAVPAFRLDERPVTEGEFRAFVAAHPEWAPGRPSALFADPGYLSHWGGDVADDRPVTRVSWFAARAYCDARGARLPTEAEWELAARVDDSSEILAWYTSNAPLPPAGAGPPNGWGVRDLHGVVWEWVEDFNGALVSFDAREQGDAGDQRFCGAGAASATVKDDYAAFMRLAFRSSLQASFTTARLGFRCAADLEPS